MCLVCACLIVRVQCNVCKDLVRGREEEGEGVKERDGGGGKRKRGKMEEGGRRGREGGGGGRRGREEDEEEGKWREEGGRKHVASIIVSVFYKATY